MSNPFNSVTPEHPEWRYVNLYGNWTVIDVETNQPICEVETEGLAKLISAAPALAWSGRKVIDSYLKMNRPIEDDLEFAFMIQFMMIALESLKGIQLGETKGQTDGK